MEHGKLRDHSPEAGKVVPVSRKPAEALSDLRLQRVEEGE